MIRSFKKKSNRRCKPQFRLWLFTATGLNNSHGKNSEYTTEKLCRNSNFLGVTILKFPASIIVISVVNGIIFPKTTLIFNDEPKDNPKDDKMTQNCDDVKVTSMVTNVSSYLR